MKEIVLPNVSKELRDAFVEIQQPRSNYVLEHFVVGDNSGSQTREYCQVVEELRRAYFEIKKGLLNRDKVEVQREELLAKNDKISKIDADIKAVELEECVAGIIGKLREFDCLYAIWSKYPKFTHEQIEAAEPEYWYKRLTAQAARDLVSKKFGLSVGNQHALEMNKNFESPKLTDFVEGELKVKLENQEKAALGNKLLETDHV